MVMSVCTVCTKPGFKLQTYIQNSQMSTYYLMDQWHFHIDKTM